MTGGHDPDELLSQFANVTARARRPDWRASRKTSFGPAVLGAVSIAALLVIVAVAVLGSRVLGPVAPDPSGSGLATAPSAMPPSTPATATPTDAPATAPAGPTPSGEPCPAGQAEGFLVEASGELRVAPERGTPGSPLTWRPSEYVVERGDGGLVVLDRDGNVVAREGDYVRLSGGHVGANNAFLVCGSLEVFRSPTTPPATSPVPPTPMFPPPSPTLPILAGEWRELPQAPIRDGRRPTAVWTGDEFIIWGTAGLADGAAYDPATDTWRRLPDGPRGPARYMAAVWTGDVVIAWHGGRPAAPGDADGGIYDPATDSWSPISPGPLNSDSGRGIAWTGSALLVLSPDMRAAAYDPATGDWRDLPSAPLAPGAVEADWTGTEWLVLGFGTDPDAAAEVAAFDPESGTWSQLAASPMTTVNEGRGAVWTGESWLWLSDGGESFAYDRAADQWTNVDNTSCLMSTGSAIWTGSVVLSPGTAFDPTTGACSGLPPLPQSEGIGQNPAIAWTGMELFVWGGGSGTGDTTTTDGAVFTPAD